MKNRAFVALAALAIVGIGLARASALPPPAPVRGRPAPKRPSPLHKSATDAARGRFGRSGVHMLADAHDAFAARMLLVREAVRTLDLQYYIWHGDRTGTLLLRAVLDAAKRGVRVRLLLDDNGIAGLDGVLAAMDRHPMVEIRLFNPFAIRFPKSIGFLTDFSRLNRRMHNKSLTADDAATIVGGRNIGDEYFGTGEGGLFADLDVLAVGPIVSDVTRDFERYWHSDSAYPAAQILPPAKPRMLRKLTRAAARVERDASAAVFVERMHDLPIVRRLVEGSLPLEWARVALISDDPAKGLGKAGPEGLLAGQLEKLLGRPNRKLGIVAGYFVPGPQGSDALAAMSRRGVDVTVLTNAYEAGDVKWVHAGYAPDRARLLSSGVRIFEMRAHTNAHPSAHRGIRLGVGSRLRGSGTGSTAALRSGATTLHAKTFTVDDRRLFIGSFNFDPRSWQLNTEMGFVIESPRLATKVSRVLEENAPLRAYELRLTGRRIEWIERGARRIVHRSEPGLGNGTAAILRVAGWLPLRWLL